jgi:hypothetical protein
LLYFEFQRLLPKRRRSYPRVTVSSAVSWPSLSVQAVSISSTAPESTRGRIGKTTRKIAKLT